MKIYFLTRSFYPEMSTGGALVRYGEVQYLRAQGWEVVVVMPNYSSCRALHQSDTIKIPYPENIKLALLCQRLGVVDDYLDSWVSKAYQYLKSRISRNDLIISTSGGELGTIKLGALLAGHCGCPSIANLHDPIDYTLVHNLKLDKKFHVSREKQEEKYLLQYDRIVTSSDSNKISLQKKYPNKSHKIENLYFGYNKKIDINSAQRLNSEKLRIAYVGNMSKTQRPEILYEAYKKYQSENRKGVKIIFVGNAQNYLPISNIIDPNVQFVENMPHDQFLQFMLRHIDVGFVSLANDYLGACTPSKIYEYINLGIPIIGALPDGDGKNIINSNGYGIGVNYDDISSVAKAIGAFEDPAYYSKVRKRLLDDRSKWDSQNLMVDMVKTIKVLSHGD